MTKTITLILLLFCNCLLMSAQTITDTIFVTHPDVAFHKYDPAAEILFVFNKEFDSSSKKWILVLDIYGEFEKINALNEEWFERYKKIFHFKNQYLYKSLNENFYIAQITSSEWIKGQAVKNGYWNQCSANIDEKLCEGFIVNNLRELKWIEYNNYEKITEGNYIHNIKEGIWHEYKYDSYHKIGEYKNGLKQGEWTDYQKKGVKYIKRNIRAKMFYVNDTLEGSYISYSFYKKNILEKGNYNRGLRDGKWVELIKKDTVQICFWENGTPIKAYIYLEQENYKNKNKLILKRYEVNLIKWKFEGHFKIGEWIFEAPSGDGRNNYDHWGVEYYGYLFPSYYYLGTY